MDNKNNESYTWIPAFKAIADWIVDYEDRQEELVDVLQDIGIENGLNDQLVKGKPVKAKVMDPFSFFSLIMKYGDENSLSIIKKLLTKLDRLELVPTDLNGLPKSNPQKVWLFPYGYERKPQHIDLLWKLFYQAKKINIDNKSFDEAMDIPNTAFTKLTQNLFYINPNKFLPIDKQTEPWLTKHGIDIPKHNFESYLMCLEQVRNKKEGKPFYEISYEAWLANQDDKKNDNKVESLQADYEKPDYSISKNMTIIPLNRILYGPPGTGKTYRTTELAVQCVAPDWYSDLIAQYSNPEQYSFEIRKKIKDKYDELIDKGRIEFTTFHQSFTYEDFVEGIRAKVEEETKQVHYDIENGVFKRIANKIARTVTRNDISGLAEKPKFWKISLGDTWQKELREYCFKHGEARIGWGYTGDLNKNLSERSEKEQAYLKGMGSNDRSSVKDFSENMKVGDVLLCLKDQDTLRAIGIVTSDYYFDTSFKGLEEFHHTRKVNWILKDISFDIYGLNNYKHLAQKTCYEIDRFTWDELAEELDKQGYSLDGLSINKEITEKENYILIIDEINRGNISRIFGELITLLEPDKRKGGSDGREVTLPYSKEKFSVPSNLYVLGTMNTADKSLAQLDLALRRRFEFIELLPKPSLLDDITVHDVKIAEMLTIMNARIEVLLDREHTIGHSYFWTLKDLDTDVEKEIELANIFEKRIIPLLQEYFFSDWERIGWVLNDPNKNSDEKFIQTENLLPELSDLFGNNIDSLVNDRRYQINEKAFSNPKSYQKILMTKSQPSESMDSGK